MTELRNHNQYILWKGVDRMEQLLKGYFLNNLAEHILLEISFVLLAIPGAYFYISIQ